MKWIALVKEIKGVFYIDILDQATRKTRHPSYPFPLESFDEGQARKKAKRTVDRANSGTEYTFEPLFLVE